MTYLDTHVLLWLHDGEHKRLSPEAKRQLDRGDLLVSPMAALELEYLFEIERLKVGRAQILSRLSAELGLKVCDLPFSTVVESALALQWTLDPFDRLIVAQARANHATLVTKDETIRRHYRQAVW